MLGLNILLKLLKKSENFKDVYNYVNYVKMTIFK